ncbi:MAG: DUF4402 domain-containing protein [Ignavibacteriae bacterium]|nr:DUF4402 domain-containing protein [Ignavibacteriota bacterium]
MEIFNKISHLQKQSFVVICGTVMFLFNSLILSAQSNSRIIDDLSLGVFYTGSTGGTVIMPAVGTRSATGSVVLFSTNTGNPALLRIELGEDEYYTVTADNIVNLTNGSGGSMSLEVNDFFPVSPFYQNQDGDRDIYIGGVLTVGSPATTTAGSYTGSFRLTIVKD